jgi:hypothetical protein
MTCDNSVFALATGPRDADGSPPDGRPVDNALTDAGPPRWWTLIVPCLLTLPVSAWCVLVAVFANILRCFDTCGPSVAPYTAIGVAEFILAAITVGTLIAGLAMAKSRRLLRRVLWAGCLLAWAGFGALYLWAQTHP